MRRMRAPAKTRMTRLSRSNPGMASQGGDQKIAEQLSESGAVEDVSTARSAKMAVGKDEAQQHRGAEDQGGGDQPGQELAGNQQLPPQRREEIIMQALFHDLAAEQ